MKVSGSSIAAYYAGNAALAPNGNWDQNRDRQAAQQAQAAAQQRIQQFKRPQPPNEQVLEGELLDNERQQQRAKLGAEEGESAPQGRFQEAPPQPVYSSNPAIRSYQATARLDGLTGGGPRHQIDIYV